MTHRAAKTLAPHAQAEGADPQDPAWFVEESEHDAGISPGAPRKHVTARALSTRRGNGRGAAGTKTHLSNTGLFDAVELSYREAGHWEDLIEMYLQRLDSAESEKDRAQLFRRIAGAFREGMGDDENAFEALVEAFRIDPHDEEGAVAVENAARKLSRFQDLVAALAKTAISEPDDGRALRVCEHAVRWCRNELHSVESAEIFLARLRKVDPSHPAVQRRLASMYRENGVWDAQRESLARAMLRATDPTERRQLHLALAEVEEERFANFAAAVAHYDEILSVEPDAIDALRGLERIAHHERAFPKLVLILEREIELAQGPEKAAALIRLAEVHEKQFLRPHVAAPYLERALTLDRGNIPALDTLERCYHALRDYDGLARTLGRRADAETDRRTRIALYFRQAEIDEEQRKDPEAAAEAYRNVLKQDDENADALMALARLAERAQDWNRAATHRARLAELGGSDQACAQMHAAIGDMLAVPGRNPARAKIHYERAVKFDPTNLPAWEALQRLWETAREPRKVAFCLTQRATFAPSGRARAQLYVELAQHAATALKDTRASRDAYELAIQSDPTNETAARVLVDVYAGELQWQKVAGLTDLLVGAALRDGNTTRAFELLCVATRASAELGENEKALKSALRAFEMRPKDADGQRAVVLICHRLRGDAKVLAPARDALKHLAAASEALSPDDHIALAEIEGALGDNDAATAAYCKALALDATHVGALGGIAAAFSARGDFGRAATFTRKLARATRDPEKKFTLLVEAAEMWAHRARNLDKATSTFEEALLLRPCDHWLLHTLLWAYGESQTWDKLTLALRSIADLEEAKDKKAKTVYAMAQVVRDKLRDRLRAAQLFEEALDLDPTRLDAFERIVRIYTELKDWGALTQAYRKMIARVNDTRDVDLKYALYHQLGLVLRDRVCHRQRALEAFTAASRLRPHADEDRKIVAELLVSLNQIALAVAATRERIAQSPTSPAGYAELAELFLRQRQFDRAWCATNVLAHLGALDHEQAEFHAAYPPLSIDEIPGTLASSAWSSHVLQRGLDKGITEIFRIATTALGRSRAALFSEAEKQALGEPLRRGHSAVGDAVLLAFQNASEIFGMTMPLLYVRSGLSVPFTATLAHAPAFLVALDAVEALAPDTLPFLVGKRLAELRPELAARAYFPTIGGLTDLLTLAVRIASAEAPAGPPSPADAAVQLAMSPTERAELRALIERAKQASGAVDVRKWLGLADLSSTRAALVLVGNVDVAARSLQRDARTAADLPSAERKRELVLFAVSDEYHELRGAIRVAIEV